MGKSITKCCNKNDINISQTTGPITPTTSKHSLTKFQTQSGYLSTSDNNLIAILDYTNQIQIYKSLLGYEIHQLRASCIKATQTDPSTQIHLKLLMVYIKVYQLIKAQIRELQYTFKMANILSIQKKNQTLNNATDFIQQLDSLFLNFLKSGLNDQTGLSDKQVTELLFKFDMEFEYKQSYKMLALNISQITQSIPDS